MLCRILLAGLIAGGALSFARGADEPASPLTLAQTVQLPQITGGTNHLAADAKRHRFFVTAPGDKKTVVVDLNAGQVLKVIDGPAAAAVFLPDLDQLCVSGGGGVAFYEGASLAPLGKVDLHASVDELQYDPRSKRVFVGVMDAGNPGIAVVDPAGRKLLRTMKLPAKPQGFVLERDGSRLYANTPAARQVTVLDRDRGTRRPPATGRAGQLQKRLQHLHLARGRLHRQAPSPPRRCGPGAGRHRHRQADLAGEPGVLEGQGPAAPTGDRLRQHWRERPSPAEPPDKYVEALAGSDIMTVPAQTLEAVQRLNRTYARTVDQMPPEEVRRAIDQQMDQQEMKRILMSEGLAKFAAPQKGLIQLVHEKRRRPASY